MFLLLPSYQVSRGGPLHVPACAGLVQVKDLLSSASCSAPCQVTAMAVCACVRQCPGLRGREQAWAAPRQTSFLVLTQFLILTCTTTFLAVPLQTPHPRKVGLHEPACAPVGWLGVSSMGLCPCLPWDGACAFRNPVYCLLQI